MRKIRQRILSSLLTGAMLLSMCGNAFAVDPPEDPPGLPTVGNIKSIQAYTDETMYGTGVVEVDVTYEPGVDLSSVTADSYILEDRGSLSPDFGQIKIDSAQVDGQVVTLTISGDTAATADNKLIYTGDSKEGSRVRNAFGIYCTGAWYRDANGTIRYGSSDSDAYENNITGMGYQARACLELKLRHTGEEESAAACLADDKGQYNSDGLWEETVDRQFGEGKFQTFEEAGIQIDSTAAGATDGTQDPYVRGYLYVPENYDPANGIVFTLQGQGISYWKLPDGSDNDGTGIMYDSATTSWTNKGAIVVNIHDRSSAGPGEYYDIYDFVVDDVNVMKYLIDQYHITGNIVLQGNSRGTMASSVILKALAGQPYSPKEQKMGYDGPKDKTLDKTAYDFTIDTFICQNGSFGGNNMYTQADYEAVAKTGLKVWCFDGEQDTNNIETVAAYKQAVADTGAAVSDDEIRLTGYTSDIYYYWGESDHSTTRMNGWYFDAAAYYGPDLSIVDKQIAYNTKLNDGDTYTLLCRGSAATSSKNGYEYTVYDDLYQAWALEGAAKATPIEESQAAPATIGSYQRINGYFTYQLSVGEESREVEVYIPDGARQREYWISMTLPNGVDSRKFLENAGWFDIADQTKACLLIMKPEEGGWGTAETEMPYVNAAMATLVSSGRYYSAFTYDYLVGYGEGAPVLQLWAAQNPLKMISQVYLDAQADSAYDALLTAAGNTQVGETPQPNHMDFVGYTDRNGDFVGYTDKDGNPLTQTRTFAAQFYQDIPIPTWFVGDTSDSLLTYWKAVNDCAASADTSADYGQVFWQDKENSDAIATSFSDVKTQVAVKSEAGVDLDSPALTQNIYNFLTYYGGYDNNSVYGHFITERLDYDTAIENGNMLYRDHMWNGTNRTYIVYVPDSVKENYDLSNPAPVVFANHGAGQTAMVFLDATDIREAADKYGFIAVTFDLTSNADYMVDLIELVKQDCESLGVAVDENRLYAYGQSAGGGAVGNTLAQSPKTVDLFAAFGMTSGVQTTAQTDGSKLVVPFYAIYGEYDYWPMKLGQVSAGEWTGSQRTQYQWPSNTQTYWAQRLLGMTLDELVDESSYTLKDNIGASMVSENTPISLIVNPTEDANRYKTYTWSIPADSGEAPIFVWSQCYGRGHNLVPSDLDELWNNWYSKWEKADDVGVLNYWAQGVGNGTSVAVMQSPLAEDLDDVTNLQKDFSQAAQLPLTGYFTKNIDVDGNGQMDDNRTVKVYIAPEASIRSYFTVVAIPDGVEDTYQFLSEQGWVDLADQKGEGLFILEPGADGWGTAADEAAYLDAATAFLKSGNNVNAQNVFSTFGEFYLVGYGKGAAALERWAAQNPIFVISQAYVGGSSVGSDSLTSVAGTLYDGKGGSYGDITEVLPDMLEQVGIDGQIAPKDVPVPTWFVSYTGSESYWKTANDCVSDAVGGVYYQDIDSDAYQTNYSNQRLKAAGASHGISQVKVSSGTATAAEIYGFLSAYTRYDNTFAYANAIADRLDYTAARVAAQQDAKDGVVNATLSDGTQILAQKDVSLSGHGTVQVGVIAFSDNNNDGKVDPREYILYIPEGFEGKDLPVLMIYPGNSQTDSIFLDSTLWWQIAEEKGIALAFICETYSASPSSISHADSDKFYNALVTLLKEKIDGNLASLDFTRVYGSGQSAGSMATQGFAVTNPEFFAAVASTSGVPMDPNIVKANRAIPDMLISGQMDIMDYGDGFDSTNLKNWASYLLGVNGFNATFAADKATSVTNVDSRHPEVYTWSKTVSGTEVPMFQWAQCLLRSHNCYPSDIPMMWDFLEHYSFAKGSNGTVTRYYSPSAFVEDDAVKIDPISNTHTGGSGSSSTKQSVVVKSTENGTISANISTAASGTAVTITVTPKSGYELKSLKVSTASGTEVTLTDKGNGQYTFTMPSTAVTITGAFAAIEAKLPYSDVQKGDWFYDAVDFVQEQGLMSGTGTTTFAPNMELSRAMIAQILYKIEQTPTSSGASFTDVAAGQWYSDAIIWASQKGIVSGYGNGQFGPNDSITREQLAAILYSYVQYKKPGTTATGSLDAFRDGASASDWAKESLIWAVNQGLMSGKTGNILDPKGTATRAEVAQILMKFLETE